jgi:hypothetical protein
MRNSFHSDVAQDSSPVVRWLQIFFGICVLATVMIQMFWSYRHASDTTDSAVLPESGSKCKFNKPSNSILMILEIYTDQFFPVRNPSTQDSGF